MNEFWNAGYDAARARLPRSVNPYLFLDFKFYEWNAGYTAYMRANQQ